jgi:hypothetical protein
LFCPGIPNQSEGSQTLSVFGVGDEPVPIAIEGNDGTEDTEVPAESIITREFNDSTALNVIGKGAPIQASVSMDLEEPVVGSASAPCSSEAASHWYLPEGSSASGYEERLLIYNPFPDEAVVRITFVTKKGEEAKANLAKVGVPSGEMIQRDVTEFIEQKEFLGSIVSAIRGRVVVWKAMSERVKGAPQGQDLSLGATEMSTEWFFPVGEIAEEAGGKVSVHNPTDKEATVTVNFLTEGQPVQPAEFVEVPVPAHRTKNFILDGLTKESGKVVGLAGAVVRSSNGVPVVAEHTVTFEGDGFAGTATEVGLTGGALTWWMGPAVTDPEKDSLVVMNLDSKEVTVNVTLYSESAPSRLAALQVPPGKRFEISLDDQGVTGASAALLESDGSVVVERVAQSSKGDVGVIAGVPVTPSEP